MIDGPAVTVTMRQMQRHEVAISHLLSSGRFAVQASAGSRPIVDQYSRIDSWKNQSGGSVCKVILPGQGRTYMRLSVHRL